MTTAQHTQPSASLLWLRRTALAAIVVTVLQLGLGIMIAADQDWARTPHGILGYTNLVVVLTAAVLAWRWSATQDYRGTFFHAVSLPVMAVLQIGLAELDIATVHMSLGVAYLVAVIGLYAVTARKR